MALIPGQGNPFPHLSLPLIIQDRARLRGGSDSSPEEIYNKAHRAEHAANLANSIDTAVSTWSERINQRTNQELPSIPPDIPLFVRVDPDSDLEFLRNFFNLEIVSEQEDGYIIVASEEINMTTFLETVDRFSNGIRGATTAAKILEIIGPENQQLRLEKILSEYLFSQWGNINNNEIYTVDIGIECLGNEYIKPPPEKKLTEPDDRFNMKLDAWRTKLH